MFKSLIDTLRARLSRRAPAPTLRLIMGDITREEVDVIVNAAKPSLLGGGGVDGAIHRAGGPQILAECMSIAAGLPGRDLPAGHAVVTSGGRLKARHVVHTVGPIYRAPTPGTGPSAVADREAYEFRASLLRSCYTTSLELAASVGARTVAFPLISSGVYGWPVHDAIRQAYAGIRASTADVDEVRLVLFDQATYLTACRLLGSD